MKKNLLFTSSNVIRELAPIYENQAKELAEKLGVNHENSLVEIHCVPNGQLNAFHYGNGVQTAEIILGLAGSFLGSDLDGFSEKITIAKKSDFKTDFDLGERLGLWSRITPNNYLEKIDWKQSFCIKNKKGLSRIWNHEGKSGYMEGFATRETIKNAVNDGPAYHQPFYKPLRLGGGDEGQVIYRLVFFHSPEKTEFIGGLWVSRNNFKVYIKKDSIVGLIKTSN
jgi:hypothetical protein